MKTKSIVQLAALLLLSTLNLQLSTIFAQGSLTPPGAPAATMKTLAQIEPRTAISSAPFTITNPGSYYLTTNLVGTAGTNGITIACGNVTLDLNGFVLLGVLGSSDGVLVNGSYTNFTVRNGAISGWGSDGVDAESYSPYNVLLERLNAAANGGDGLEAANGRVESCCCASNAYHGIFIENGMVSGCVVRGNGGYGIFADLSTVRDCQSQANAGSGIYAAFSTVSGCYVSDNVQSGIYVNYHGCQIVGNNCQHNNTSANVNHAGISILDNNNRVEDNHVTISGHAGIQVVNGYVNNIIIRNTVIGSGANNYSIPAGQVVGPLIITTGTITNLNPWANFSF